MSVSPISEPPIVSLHYDVTPAGQYEITTVFIFERSRLVFKTMTPMQLIGARGYMSMELASIESLPAFEDQQCNSSTESIVSPSEVRSRTEETRWR
jgi:hypothetical protein